MNCTDIREAFLSYFESKGHTRVSSSPLLTQNDPTLLFSNAGMNQFKDIFTGAEKRDYVRATTAQKCLRISRKHNDFQNVGITARHHTFFEMMGNFSFGDYFKKEAILFAWEFSTEVIKLDKNNIWITIFEEDDEAGKLWAELTDVDPARILKMGAEENYWAMGDTGPCGPCSEMHYYVGDPKVAQSEEEFRKDDGRYLEFWNLVFMQFNKQADGAKTPLPKPSVDTGMGLERMASLVAKTNANYECEELRSVISLCEERSGFSYVGNRYGEALVGNDEQYLRDVAMRVIADHSRAVTFLAAEGLVPGSDGRAYVLRRLIRRAVRHARVLNFSEPILKQSCAKVIETMGSVYPEIKEQQDIILRVVDAEERKFQETIDAGLTLLESEVADMKEGSSFSGKTAFLLHDTYGFPLDLTEDALKKHGLVVDGKEFEAEMEAQRERSRGDRKSQNIQYSSTAIEAIPTEFLGYAATKAESELLQVIFEEGKESAKAGESCQLIFKATPFYAESGGQVADTGVVDVGGVSLSVTDVQKVQTQYFVHTAEVTSGVCDNTLIGKKAALCVDEERRSAIARNHSATHLVHEALRQVLGEHVKQAGSRVDECSLRFDYSHFEPVSQEELQKIVAYINAEVRRNVPVITEELSPDEARERGATALFGEKYGDVVRMVQIGPDSLELCGGTHAERSGDIGAVFVAGESSIAAGVRRIECITGEKVLGLLWEKADEEQKIAQLLKGDTKHLSEKVEKVLAKQKELEKELSRLKMKEAGDLSSQFVESARISPQGVKVVTAKVDNDVDTKTLRSMVDRLRLKLGSGVVALATTQNEKGMLVAGVTSDLVPSVHAGNLVKQASVIAGGRGGGRADFAQAGGLEQQKLEAALDEFYRAVE